MEAKNKVQVLIGGKIYTLSGYESEEYLQKVGTYLNSKIMEIRTLEGYSRMTPDMRNLLLNLNTADDYFKLKRQADQMSEQLSVKDRELYRLKQEIVDLELRRDTLEQALKELQEEYARSQKRIIQLETQLSNTSFSDGSEDENSDTGFEEGAIPGSSFSAAQSFSTAGDGPEKEGTPAGEEVKAEDKVEGPNPFTMVPSPKMEDPDEV